MKGVNNSGLCIHKIYLWYRNILFLFKIIDYYNTWTPLFNGVLDYALKQCHYQYENKKWIWWFFFGADLTMCQCACWLDILKQQKNLNIYVNLKFKSYTCFNYKLEL